MNNRINLELGRLAWSPSRGWRMTRELNRWDMPTAGILKQRLRRRYFLFRCMTGATGRYNVWAYAPLTAGEVRELKRLTGDALRDKQSEIFLRGGTLQLSVMDETAGIIHRSQGLVKREDDEPALAPEVIHKVEQEIQDEGRAVGLLAAFG
jgi:hypothetical protein